MSLHVQLSEQAQASLKAQKRKSTISSILASILVVAVIFLIMGLFLLPNIVKETPTIVTYTALSTDESEIQEKKVSRQIQKQPAAPATAISKVITSNTLSAVSIPVPDVDFSSPSADFGDAQDFGTGWGDAVGFGSGGTGGFGSKSANSGGLPGFIYDLKQTNNGKPRGYNPGLFLGVAATLIKEKFGGSILNNYYQAPNSLYLTRLAIPKTSATEGPKFFNAEKEIEPRGWIAHYQGTVKLPETGTYRFSGGGDDWLHVMIDGEIAFNFHYSNGMRNLSDYKPTGRPGQGRAATVYMGKPLNYGEWVNLRAGQNIKLDIAVGEQPGGSVGFFLQIEKKGVNYKIKNGHPILPLFTTVAFSDDEIKELQDQSKAFELDFDNTLVFPIVR